MKGDWKSYSWTTRSCWRSAAAEMVRLDLEAAGIS
jgi:hypothetical protein